MIARLAQVLAVVRDRARELLEAFAAWEDQA